MIENKTWKIVCSTVLLMAISVFFSGLYLGNAATDVVLKAIKIKPGFSKTLVLIECTVLPEFSCTQDNNMVVIAFNEPVRCKSIRRFPLGAKGVVKKVVFLYKDKEVQDVNQEMIDAIAIETEELEDFRVDTGRKTIKIGLTDKDEDLGIGRSKDRLVKKEGNQYELQGRDYGILQDIDLNVKHDRVRVTIEMDKPVEFTDAREGENYLLIFKTPVKDHHLKLPEMRGKDGLLHIAKMRNKEESGWKRGKFLDALNFTTRNIGRCYAWAEGEKIIIDMFYLEVPKRKIVDEKVFVDEWGDSRYVHDVEMDVLSDRTRAVFSLNKLFNYTVIEDEQPDTITIKFEQPVQSSLPLKHIRGKGDINSIYFLNEHLKPIKKKKRDSIISGILIKTPGPAFSDVYNDEEKNILVVDVVSFQRALDRELNTPKEIEEIEGKTSEDKIIPKIGRKVKFKALVNQAWIDDIRVVTLRRMTAVFLSCNKGIGFQVEQDETDDEHLKLLLYFTDPVRSKLQQKDFKTAGVVTNMYPIYKEEDFIRDIRVHYRLLEAIGFEVDRVLSYNVVAEKNVIAIKFMHPDIFNRQGLFADYVNVDEESPKKVVWEGGVLTLDKAIALAVENNYTILKSKADIERARGVIATALAKKFPKLSMSAEYVLTSDSLIEDVTAYDYFNYNEDSLSGKLIKKFIDFFLPTDEIQYGNEHVFNVDFKVTQLLYAGGKVLGPIKVAKLLEKIASEYLFIAKEQVVYNVKKVFYQVILNRDLIDLNKQSFEVYQKKLQVKQDEFRTKVASAHEVLEVQVEVEEQRPRILMAENQLRLAKDNLRFLLGIEDVPMEIEGELAFQAADVSLEHAMEVALKNRPEMIVKQFHVRTSREKIKIAQGGYLPTIMAFGDYVFRSKSFTVEGDDEDFLQGWIAGVRAEVPIWDTIETKGKVRQAQASYKKSVLELKELENQIRVEVQEVYWKVREAEAKVIPELKKVQLSEEKLKLAKSKYERGESIPLEVETMEVALLKAKIEYLKALYELEMFKASLQKVMGVGYIERHPLTEFSAYYNTNDNFERTY